MTELTIWTLDWVPEGPRGFVRDLRLRWACEEAGLAYSVRSVPFEGAKPIISIASRSGRFLIWTMAGWRYSKAAPACCTLRARAK